MTSNILYGKICRSGGLHYPYDYGFFVYKFHAQPPYSISHVSNIYIPSIPYDVAGHTGVLFPLGLFRLRNGTIVISYGDQDQASRLLLLDAQFFDVATPIEQLLMPTSNFTIYTLPVTLSVLSRSSP